MLEIMAPRDTPDVTPIALLQPFQRDIRRDDIFGFWRLLRLLRASRVHERQTDA
jgi:hypothetical protein